MFCAYTIPRYQVSVYRIIGPLVIFYFKFVLNKKGVWLVLEVVNISIINVGGVIVSSVK